MRVWFVVLLMVLLPLRGWAGDAMAVSMATDRAPAAALVAAADCHGAADHTHDQHGSQDSHQGHEGHGTAHLLCDVCNGPALTPAAMLAVGDARPHSLHIPSRVAFASEAPRRGVRPPIA